MDYEKLGPTSNVPVTENDWLIEYRKQYAIRHIRNMLNDFSLMSHATKKLKLIKLRKMFQIIKYVTQNENAMLVTKFHDNFKKAVLNKYLEYKEDFHNKGLTFPKKSLENLRCCES